MTEQIETLVSTSHGAAGDETEVVPSVIVEDTPLLAYSAYPEANVEAAGATWGETWYRAAGCAAIGVLVVLAGMLLRADVSNPATDLTTSPSSVVPAPMHPVPARAPVAAAPSTTPTTTPREPAPAAPLLTAEDQLFLAMLQRDGHPHPASVPNAIAAAADVCRMVSRGDDFGYVESFLTPPATQKQAEVFVTDALAAYCPHAAIPTPVAAPPQPSLTPDQQFIADVNARLAAVHMSVSNPAKSASDGHRACDYIAQGHTVDQTIAEAATGLPASLPAWKAHTIAESVVGAAVRVYCPQYGG